MYDIDKKNLYWSDNMAKKIFNFDKVGVSEVEEAYQDFLELNPDSELTLEDYTKKFAIKENQSNKLLDLERQILLHPRNLHNLLMPVTDEIFVKGVYRKLVDLKVINPVGKSLMTSIQPHVNVKKSRVFVGGKTMVGPIALAVTGHSVKQADGFKEINPTYVNGDDLLPTNLRFAGMEKNFSVSSYTDEAGNVILEALSQQLSIAVDNVKNPVADDMLMNMQTIGVIGYLLIRGVSPTNAMYFINQPLIKQYLLEQVKNESLFNKQQKKELRKDELLSKVLTSAGYSNRELPEIPEDWSFTEADLRKGLKDNNFNEQQLLMLGYFLELLDQSKIWLTFNSTQNSDTKGIKDRQQYLETLEARRAMGLIGMIPDEYWDYSDQQGVISPFYKYGRLSYQIYKSLYSIETSPWGGFLRDTKASMASIAKAVDKDRIRQTLENDFLLFFIHNNILDPGDRERLMMGDDSLPHRIAELKKELPSNLVLKAFLPLLNHTTDPSTGKRMSNLKLFDRELNALDQEDLLQQIDEIATKYPDVYEDLVKMLFFQTGLNNSPFNYKSIIPVGLESERGIKPDYYFLYQDIISEAVKAANRVRSEDEGLYREFVKLFDLNNTRYLRPSAYGGHLVSKGYSEVTKSNVYTYENRSGRKVVSKERGSVYTKNYVMDKSDAFIPTKDPDVEEAFNKVYKNIPITVTFQSNKTVLNATFDSIDLDTGMINYITRNGNKSTAIRDEITGFPVFDDEALIKVLGNNKPYNNLDSAINDTLNPC